MGRILSADQVELVETSPSAARPAGRRVLSADDVEEIPADYGERTGTPSKWEAIWRGAAQGATFGFADEIAGGLEAAFTDKTYDQARDESRTAHKAAREEHPLTYGGAELGGGVLTALVPGMGIARGAGLAANIARGAGSGIASGIGHSEGKDVAEIARDAGVSGLVGGAVGGTLGYGAGRLLKGAQERIDKRTLTDLGQRATKTMRDRMADNAPATRRVAEKYGLVDDVARDPKKLEAAVRGPRSKAGAVIARAYEAADTVIPDGIDVQNVTTAMHGVADRLMKNAATRADARAVFKIADDVIETYGDRVSAKDLHSFVSKMGNAAFEGVPDANRKALEKDVTRAVRGVLVGHVKEAAKTAPGELKKALRGLGAANKEYGPLKDISKAAKYRARLDEFKPTGLRSFSARGLAEEAYERTAGKVARPADRAIADLVKRARAGEALPKLLERAAELGVPRGTAEKISGMFAKEEDELELF